MSMKWIAAVAATAGIVWFAGRDSEGGLQLPEQGPSDTHVTSVASHTNSDDAIAGTVGSPVEKEERPASARAAIATGEEPALESPAALSIGLTGQLIHDGAPLAGARVLLGKAVVSVTLDELGRKRTTMTTPDPLLDSIRTRQGMYSNYPATSIDPRIDGEPPALVVLPRRSHDLEAAVTDSQGRFQFESVPEVEFVLTARHKELDLALRDEVRVPTGDEWMDVGTLELHSTATLRGTLSCDHCLRLDGHKLALAGVANTECATDANGEFVIESVPAGSFLLDFESGDGIYRRSSSYSFLRLEPGEERTITVPVPSEPCSLVTVEVLCNGEPFSDQRIGFLNADEGHKIVVSLDDLGRGKATLPARTVLMPVAYFGANKLSLGDDVVLSEGSTTLSLFVEAGEMKVRVPTRLLPAPELAQLDFRTNADRVSAIRFDLWPNIEGPSVALDESGYARVTVPAWTRLEPVLRIRDQHWLYIETDRAIFAAGESEFRLDMDPENGAVRLTGGDRETAPKDRPTPRQYRLALKWSDESSGRSGRLVSTLNPLEFAMSDAEFQNFEFQSVPSGHHSFEFILERRSGNGWTRHTSWTRELEIDPTIVREVTVGESEPVK